MKNVKDFLGKSSRELVTLSVLVIIILVFSVMAPRYLEIGNLADIIDQATINGFLAFGMTFVIITGGIDLSVGASTAVVIVSCAQLSVHGVPAPIVMLIGILLGAMIGMFNGLIITKMKLQPFIATLGTCSILRGIAYLITGGWPVMNIPSSFRSIFQTALGPNFSFV